jgi:hypothetical protein
MSEKNAIKDASFVAYKALHHACPVNDNLLPLLPPDSAMDELISSSVVMRVLIVNVREQLNPWVEIARAWQRSEGTVYEAKITVGELQMKTWLPTPVPKLTPFHTYWDAETTFVISLSTSASIAINLETMLKAWDDTWALLNTAFGSMFAIQQKRVIMPFFSNTHISQMQQMGRQPVTDDIQFKHEPGLIRDKSEQQVSHVFRELLSTSLLSTKSRTLTNILRKHRTDLTFLLKDSLDASISFTKSCLEMAPCQTRRIRLFCQLKGVQKTAFLSNLCNLACLFLLSCTASQYISLPKAYQQRYSETSVSQIST